MAQDEYFSFGDEDLGGDFAVSGFEGDQPLGNQAVALAEPREISLDEFEVPSSAAERATHPRGDSKRDSSERRGPSSRRTQLLAVAAVAVLALMVVRITIAVIDAPGPAVTTQDTAAKAQDAADHPGTAEAPAAKQLRASRERAAERQQVRQRREKTRNRARRSRARRAAGRERRADMRPSQQSPQEASGASGEAPTEYIPPAPEVAPETAPNPAPESSPPLSEEAGLQDGSSSPEFGL